MFIYTLITWRREHTILHHLILHIERKKKIKFKDQVESCIFLKRFIPGERCGVEISLGKLENCKAMV